MADANSLEQRTMIDIPTGRCRIKSQGQFVKRVPSLDVLRRPRQPVEDRPWLNARPVPKQRKQLIRELEHQQLVQQQLEQQLISYDIERRREEVRQAARQEQKRRGLRKVRSRLPGHNLLKNRRNRDRLVHRNAADPAGWNLDSNLNVICAPPSTVAGTSTSTSSSPKSEDVIPPKREKEDLYRKAEKGIFPTFLEDGSLPGYPAFNPLTTDYSDWLGDYEVKVLEEIPLKYFEAKEDPQESEDLVPTHVIEHQSAYLFKLPDPETGKKNMYVLPAGHYCPSLRIFLEVGAILLQKLSVGEDGEEWQIYQIIRGYFLSHGNIYYLPKGTLITRTPVKEMTHLNKFVQCMDDERPSASKIVKEFKNMAEKLSTDPGIKPQYGLRSRNDILKSVLVPEYYTLMQYHSQVFKDAGTFCLLRGFFGWFKHWPMARAMGEMTTKDQIISAMELFIFLLEIEILGYYGGPAPPYSFLRQSKFSDTISARENAAILHKKSFYKRKARQEGPHGEEWSAPGGNRSRRPSNLAVSSGLHPDSISIDTHGSNLDLNVRQGNRPRWFEPRATHNVRLTKGPVYLPRGRTGSDRSWVTVNSFESDSDSGSVFSSDKEDRENTPPVTDLSSEHFPKRGPRYNTQLTDSTISLAGSSAGSWRRGRIGSRVRQGVERVRGSLSRLNQNQSGSTSGYPSLGNYGLFK